MNGDKLVITLGGRRFALDTSVIDGIVEVERIPFLPGRTGFVEGIISLRGEPVTVIDIKKVFKGAEFSDEEKGLHKIVVVRDKNRLLGFDIGSSNVSFLWKEEMGDGACTKESGRYTSGRIELEEEEIRIIDWAALFNEAARLLSSSEDSGV